MKKLVSIVLVFVFIIVMTNAAFACTVDYRVYCHYNAVINTCPNGTIPDWSYNRYWSYNDYRDDDDRDDEDRDDDDRPEFSNWQPFSWLKGLFSWFH